MRIVGMGIEKQIGLLLTPQMARKTVHAVCKHDALRLDAAQFRLAAKSRIHRGIAAAHPQHAARNRRQQPRPYIEDMRSYLVVGIEAAEHKRIGWQPGLGAAEALRLRQRRIACKQNPLIPANGPAAGPFST